MDDDVLLKITNSMTQKLGDEASATISDDLGELITRNGQTQETLNQANARIKELEATNQKLIVSNGNLLKMIPMEKTEVVDNKNEAKAEKIKLKDAFDSNGNFLR